MADLPMLWLVRFCDRTVFTPNKCIIITKLTGDLSEKPMVSEQKFQKNLRVGGVD